jgi:hypothetical protein
MTLSRTITDTRSAYPPPVDDLIPAARDLAVEIGEVPSRNRLMQHLKIGAPKATALRDRLLAETQIVANAPYPAEPGSADESHPAPALDPDPLINADGHPGAPTAPAPAEAAPRPLRSWPVLLLALPAFVAIWSGWVGIGGLTGFGVVHPLPGIADGVRLNTAITLPIGVETYAAFALRVWLSGRVPARARRWAKWSAIGSLALGAAGQVAYHLLAARHVTAAPFQVTVLVSCLPVAVLGMGAALAHLMRDNTN